MAARHTPGPWKTKSKFGPRSASIVARSWDQVVAKVFTRKYNTDGVISDGRPAIEADPEGEANARLIAAAPELLEALEHAVRWFDQLKPEDIARYRVSIEKATGGV